MRMSRLFLKCVTKNVLLWVNFQSLQTFCFLINKNDYHHSNTDLNWILKQVVVFLKRKNYRQLSMHHNQKNIEKHWEILFFLPLNSFRKLCLPQQIAGWLSSKYYIQKITVHIEDTTKVENILFHLALFIVC